MLTGCGYFVTLIHETCGYAKEMCAIAAIWLVSLGCFRIGTVPRSASPHRRLRRTPTVECRVETSVLAPARGASAVRPREGLGGNARHRIGATSCGSFFMEMFHISSIFCNDVCREGRDACVFLVLSLKMCYPYAWELNDAFRYHPGSPTRH